MMYGTTRGRLASLLVGLLATSMVTVTAATAGSAGAAAPSAVGVTAAETAGKQVLSNEYGSMGSQIQGDFGKNGVVTGTFKPRRFITENGNLMAVGLLRATMTRGDGKVVGTAEKVVTIPVRSAGGTPVSARAGGDCEILHLVLGPLDLNLLGLKVHLDKVVLNIDAAPGAGNLLGNLLCAVAGLLDNAGVLTQIRQILNSILAILKI